MDNKILNSNCSFWEFEKSISCQEAYHNMSGRAVLNDCCNSTLNHLKNVGLFGKKIEISENDLIKISEKGLIKMRLCIPQENTEVDSLVICAAHRHKLGIGWRLNTKCHHRVVSNKSYLDKRINIDLANKLIKICSINPNKKDLFYHVGTMMCIDCYEDLTTKIEEQQKILNINAPFVERKSKMVAIQNLNSNKQNDSMEIDDESLLDVTSDEAYISYAHHIWEPFNFRKNWDDLSKEWKFDNYLSKTLETISDLLETQYGEHAQSAWDALKFLNPFSKIKTQVNEFETKCGVLIDAFDQNSNKDTQNQILSMIPGNFSRETIVSTLNISKRQLDNARRHCKTFGIGQKSIKEKKIIHRFDRATIDSFMSFITSEDYLQDVAYGTTKIKLENKSIITIPQNVRKASIQTIIDDYQKMCQNENITALSRSSCYRLLKACPASYRKCLHGKNFLFFF